MIYKEDVLDGRQLESALVAELGVIRKEAKSIKERIERLKKWTGGKVDHDTERVYLLEAEELSEQLNEQVSSVYVLVSRATLGLYSPSEVADWMAHCEENGCPRPPITDKTLTSLIRLEKVPNSRLREAYIRAKSEGSIPGHIARQASERLGELEREHKEDFGSASLMHCEGIGAANALERMLGVRTCSGKGKGHIRVFIGYFQAVALCHALGVDYRYVGV